MRNEFGIGSVDGTMWKSRNTDQARADRTLPDRETPIEISGRHFVTGAANHTAIPEGLETVLFGMGCFWGAEREFWLTDGVVATAVGYAGGTTRNPSYEDVCSGRTGHTEAVLVVYDPKVVSFGSLLKRFWEAHDPTQGMRQGPDRGIAVPVCDLHDDTGTTDGGARFAGSVRCGSGSGRFRRDHDRDPTGGRTSSMPRSITSSIWRATWLEAASIPKEFYFGAVAPPAHPIAAEGYCGMQPTGVSCPIGLHVDAPDATSHNVGNRLVRAELAAGRSAASGCDVVHGLGATGETTHEAGADGGDGSNQGNADECDKKRILDHTRAAAVHEIDPQATDCCIHSYLRTHHDDTSPSTSLRIGRSHQLPPDSD